MSMGFALVAGKESEKIMIQFSRKSLGLVVEEGAFRQAIISAQILQISEWLWEM